jgi:hypothetical protein
LEPEEVLTDDNPEALVLAGSGDVAKDGVDVVGVIRRDGVARRLGLLREDDW